MHDDDSTPDEQLAEGAMLEAIENQLAAGEPAATQATLNKLTLVGYAREEAVLLMARVLAHEVREMLAEDRAFDLATYETNLRALPALPGEPADDEVAD